jgi:1-acyl-sn-glycerol-3-phosphate acyltransferase
VLIAAPHTSIADFFYVLAFAWALRVPLAYMMKHTMFVGPLGWWLRRAGGIPIRRHLRENVVADAAARLRQAPALALVVPPEGTRRRVEHWRSGFYHIARAADVPVVMGFLDYGRRRGGFGPAFRPSGDLKRDMDAVRSFYADKVGRHPERFATPRLREEEADGLA